LPLLLTPPMSGFCSFRRRIVRSRAKTGVSVSVPIPVGVAEELLAVANGNPKYVFWNHTGGQAETAAKNWSSELRQVFVEAGLPNGHSHQLRDTAAVEWLQAGIPLKECFEVARARFHPDNGKTLRPVGEVTPGSARRSGDGVEGPKGLVRGALSECPVIRSERLRATAPLRPLLTWIVVNWRFTSEAAGP
jgi:hypothetical protein